MNEQSSAPRWKVDRLVAACMFEKLLVDVSLKLEMFQLKYQTALKLLLPDLARHIVDFPVDVNLHRHWFHRNFLSCGQGMYCPGGNGLECVMHGHKSRSRSGRSLSLFVGKNEADLIR